MLLQLPHEKNSENLFRKVGLELEFTGLELDDTALIIQNLYGGEIEKENRYEYQIKDTSLGNFTVELDARILKKMEAFDFLKEWDLDTDEQKIKDSLNEVVDKLAKTVIPLEIVMPAIPYTELEQLEKLRNELHQRKAEGTESSWMHAFGMHMNIEAPDLNAETLVRYLKAFFILYPWLLQELKIDLSRRVTPFIDPFPKKYVQWVLDPGYKPSKEKLIEDYLKYNPTRNRPLDMLPLLSMIDEKSVNEALKGQKNKSRPTFHYRLPNSRINDPNWSFISEWELWLQIEYLSVNDEMLSKLSRLYLLRLKDTLVSFRKEWTETVKILLDLHE